MFKKNIFILIFFISFSCKSKNILLNSDSIINTENYRWVITNNNPYTDKINIPLKKIQVGEKNWVEEKKFESGIKN